MLIMFECTVVGQRLRTLRELRSLQTPKQKLSAYRWVGCVWLELPGLLVVLVGWVQHGVHQEERTDSSKDMPAVRSIGFQAVRHNHGFRTENRRPGASNSKVNPEPRAGPFVWRPGRFLVLGMLKVEADNQIRFTFI
jgi:hypothetical protein